LKKLSEKAVNELNAPFQAQLVELKKIILDNPKPKQLQGKNLTGVQFADYVRDITACSTPNIQSVWVTIRNNECKRALAEA
jgi:hypothetical protein